MRRAFSAASHLALRLAALLCLLLLSAFAQPPQKPTLSSQARLLAARTAYIEHTGARLPYDVISEAFQGWGHYTLVGDPAKADLIIVITAPVSESGVSVSGADSRSGGKTVTSSTITQIRLNILDARDRVALWTGAEQPKGAMKERQREDNAIEASLKLFRRFRVQIEPEPAP